MSRCNDWHNAHEGIMAYLIKEGIATDRNVIYKAKKHIYKHTKTGSFSQRCLDIGENFNEFKIYINQVKEHIKQL